VITVLAGGVGAARFLRGLVEVLPPDEVTAVVNVADDLVLHGLSISPDLDTVTYTLADAIDPERGWGLADETWRAMEMLGRLGGERWFDLGDRDLGTHLYRTERLSAGADLATVTAEIATALGVGVRVLPVTNDVVRTFVTLPDEGGIEVPFQRYFVERRHDVRISAVRFEGAAEAVAAQGVMEAITESESVVIAPSNPIVSIGPVLAVPGVRGALERRREHVVAISPIVAGTALKGPADRMLRELGHDASVVGVARLYATLASVLVVDDADRESAALVEQEGLRCVVTDTIMTGPQAAAAVARTTLGALS
jgi:LPPG:FO 2-phospho-L-lactate transferase